jgi:hypothetical protein
MVYLEKLSKNKELHSLDTLCSDQEPKLLPVTLLGSELTTP